MTIVKPILKLILWLFVLVGALSGCGGLGSSTDETLPPLPDFVPGSVSDVERTAALDEVNAFYETLKDIPHPNDQVLAKLKSMPIFVYSEISKSQDVVAWFKDGRSVVVGTSLINEIGTTLSPPKQREPAAPEKALTHSKKAVLINAMEPARPDPTDEIAPLLFDKGYDVSIIPGTVEAFTNLRDLGLLYVDAHGTRLSDKFRKPKFWYSTSTRTSSANDEKYRTALDNGTMIYGLVKRINDDHTTTTIEVYFISTQFLQDAGTTFAPNAAWATSACSSFGDEATSFAKNEMKVAIYLGWDLPCRADQATETFFLLFDRLLGLNTFLPDAEKSSPLLISDAMTLLRTTMRQGTSVSYGQTESGNTTSTLDVEISKNLSIIPSITNTNVDFTDNTLTIEGYFGPAEGAGAVTLNGSNLNVKSWTETKVIVDKPTATSGKLLLRGLGTASANGYLFSNSFDYQAVSIKLNPAAVTLNYNENQTFTAQIDAGSAPANAKYRWTVVGDGLVNGSTTATTTTNSAVYRSSNKDGTDTLKLELLDSSNRVIAKTDAAINIGTGSRISFVLSGNWEQGRTPPNGSYSYSPGEGTRFTPEEGKDVLAFAYNIGLKDQTIGVLVTIMVDFGQPVSAPTTYNVAQSGQPFSPGEFILTLSTNQADPDDPDARQFMVGTIGTLTINSITNLPDNKKRVSFTFDLSNGAGGTVTGSGVQIYSGI